MKFRLTDEDQSHVLSRIRAQEGMSQGYLGMLLLSSIICSFGLIANSTATVIGAATIAPLTDPILGIALGMVRGQTGHFRRSLGAEVVGVAICLVAGAFLALMFGAERIDFFQSEIIVNTRPTLLDLAIGFSAGLAAAYAAINSKIGHAAAGVAIAISLVPPLCASGICLGGALAGQDTWRLAGGSFVLFFANFVAIEAAAGLLFTLAGLSRWKALRQDKQLWRAFVVNLILVGLTAWFLQKQLTLMLQERMADKVVRRVVSSELSKLSGARLDSLRLRYEGDELKVEVLARSPEELSVSFAKQLQEEIAKQVEAPVELRIGTALSSYVSPTGRLFVPEPGAPTPQEILRENTEWALQQALARLPYLEFIHFRELESERGLRRLFVLVRGPYVVDDELVKRLQAETLLLLSSKVEDPGGLELTVRTTLTQDYTAAGRVPALVESLMSEHERRTTELEQRAQETLARELEPLFDTALLEARASLRHSDDEPEQESLEVRIVVRSATLIADETAQQWQQQLNRELAMPVELKLTNVLGRSVEVPAPVPTPAVSPTPTVFPTPVFPVEVASPSPEPEPEE